MITKLQKKYVCFAFLAITICLTVSCASKPYVRSHVKKEIQKFEHKEVDNQKNLNIQLETIKNDLRKEFKAELNVINRNIQLLRDELSSMNKIKMMETIEQKNEYNKIELKIANLQAQLNKLLETPKGVNERLRKE